MKSDMVERLTRNLHLVFSEPPADVPDAEFDRWYDAHLEEILATPGFVSAQRFRVENVVENAVAPIRYRYLTVYEIDGDPNVALAELARLGLGSQDSYTKLKDVDSGSLPLPDWFGRVGFASVNCYALGDRVEAKE
jgi:hypothetical protein